MSTAISSRPVPVAVEFDAFGKRVTKRFEDAFEARKFYASKLKAGKNPIVKGEHAAEVTNGAAETEPKAEKASKAKSNKQAKKAPTKKEEPAKDALGCRVGSQSSQINAALTSKPKTIEAIIKSTGLASARVRAHIKFLIAKKLVTETSEGVRIKAGK